MRRPLDIVGKVHIPAAVLEHRFVTEALAAAVVLDKTDDKDHRVIGTSETGQCELYGWGASIKAHRDNTGWTYLVMLNEGVSVIRAAISLKAQNEQAMSCVVHAVAGDVIRLNDFHLHWTVDPWPRVAAFVSTGQKFDDAGAIRRLTDGINRLAAGDYYGAPRMKDGFRVLAGDEVWVFDSDSGGRVLMLAADAERDGRMVLRCGVCDQPAFKVDPHFPYHWDMNRCAEHMNT